MDGDAKVMSAIEKLESYGSEDIPKKIECKNHFRKRAQYALHNWGHKWTEEVGTNYVNGRQALLDKDSAAQEDPSPPKESSFLRAGLWPASQQPKNNFLLQKNFFFASGLKQQPKKKELSFAKES